MSFLLFLGNSRQVSSNQMKNLVNYSLRFFPHHVRLKFQMSLSVHSSKNPRRNSSQSPTIRMSMICSGDPFQAKEDINISLAGFLATILGAQKGDNRIKSVPSRSPCWKRCLKLHGLVQKHHQKLSRR